MKKLLLLSCLCGALALGGCAGTGGKSGGDSLPTDTSSTPVADTLDTGTTTGTDPNVGRQQDPASLDTAQSTGPGDGKETGTNSDH